MNIFKKRISLILSVVMVALLILPIFAVNASSMDSRLAITTTIGSQTVEFDKTYTVKGGEQVVIKASAKASGVRATTLAYCFEGGNKVEENVTELRATVPTGTPGSTRRLLVWVGGVDDNKNEQIVPDWQSYTLRYANTEGNEVSMTVTMDSKTLTAGKTYEVKGGEKIKAVSSSSYASMAFIGYYYKLDNGTTTEIVDVNGGTLNITVPTGTPGTTRTLYIEAVASNNKNDNETRTGWQKFILKYPDSGVSTEKDANVFYNGEELANNSTTEANPGESLRIEATPANGVSSVKFRWDNDAWQTAGKVSSYSTRIPSSFLPGSTHWFYVKVEYTDGTVVDRAYKFVIPNESNDITVNVKLESTTMTSGKTYEVVGGEDISVTASCNNSSVDYITYHFDNESSKKVNSSKANFQVPDGKTGKTIKLYVEAVAVDGTTTGEKVFNLKYVEATTGKLDVEPWMEENDEISELSINLRNDSEEEDKANKNIYELDEVVTYYIDYKNGTSSDITSEVSIKLELPLDFDVVNSSNGSVDEDDRTITWVFPDGLEEGESGTIVVKVKYTAFTKSKYDNERIYPSAAIYKANKEKDRSTVINLIIEEYGKEIDELHEPYMYGDLNANTFRPDDTITRAEGALVLARIYGLNYLNTRVTNLYSDLGDTYEEAQKAIVAASQAGLINGYTDGTYRPNEKMTKAEFMKILACMVEELGEDEDIEGLEIKSVDNLIKVYADSTRYYIVDGKRIYSHWALEEVSLLARLNMTPLSADDDEIELDEEISRAEVAQLVNFYLLRAPANVDSRTRSGFDDVARKHKLFADIVEATRDAHTFSMEEDGTEVEE